MSSEITEILRTSVMEFVNKNVPSGENGLEKSGITPDLRKKLGEQGFLNLKLPAEAGGTGMDAESYIAVLEEFAKAEPSIAMEMFFLNSVAGRVLSHFEDGIELLKRAGRGEISFMTAIPSEFSRISSHSTETTITSDVPIAAGGSSDFLLMTDQSGRTLLVKDKINVRKIQKPLGFRAITWGGVETKNSQYEDLGKGKLEEIFLKQVNLEITAMALGIAEGAIEKTLEYTKVRKVFNTPLKDFGPVAAAVTNMKGEIDLVKHSLDSERREENSEVLRHASLELALNSARTSVQYHGGYGYFESFGIEKFYRDAMAMKMIFGGLKPRELLYRKIYGSDSGRI